MSRFSSLGFAGLLGLGTILAIVPLVEVGYPATADAGAHYYRLVQLSLLVSRGVLFSRWAPDLVDGLGYPLFSFVPPLTYYLALVPALAGAGQAGAVNLLAAASLALAGGAFYVLLRDHACRLASALGGLAYLFAPMRLWEAYFEGNLPQLLGWSLVPLALWGLGGQGWRRRVVATGSLAALLLTHAAAASLGWLTAAGYAVSLGRRGLARRAAVFLFAAALASGFWLPAAVETGWVRAGKLGKTSVDFRGQFLTATDLLGPTRPRDPLAANPASPIGLGGGQLALAAAGLVTLAGRILGSPRRAPSRAQAARWRSWLFFGLTAFTGAFLSHGASLLLWESVPFLPWLEFPHRFLFSAALGLAGLVGLSAGELVRVTPPGWRRGAAASAMALLVVLAEAPRLYPAAHALFGDPTAAGIHAYERATGAWGTTSSAEYLPAWVETDLGSLRDAGQAAKTRWQRVRLRGPVTPSETYRTSKPGPAGWVRLPRVYYPGWTALVDGQPVPMRAGAPSGLAEVDVPAGTGQVILSYTGTPLRTAAVATSLAALAAGGLLLARSLRRRRPGPSGQGTEPPASVGPWTEMGPALVLAAFLVLKPAWIDPRTSLFRVPASRAGQPPAQVTSGVRFGADQVVLLGHDRLPVSARRGDSVAVTLYWSPLPGVREDYRTFLHLGRREEPNQPLAVSDHRHPGHDYPFTRWSPEHYIRDPHVLTLPADLPTASYFVWAGVYDAETGRHLTKEPGAPGPYGNLLEIATLIVLPRADEQPQRTLDPPPVFDRDIHMVGYSLEDGSLVLYWQATSPPSRDWSVFVHVLDATGQRVAQADGFTVSGLHPTSDWLPGAMVVDPRPLPPDLPADGRILIGLYDYQTGERASAVQGGRLLPESAFVIELP